MLIRQAVLLQTHGEKLLEGDFNKKNTVLAMECLREAREIVANLQGNSVVLFFEFASLLGLTPHYSVYLEFCARNSLQMMSEQDFKGVLEETTKKLLDCKIEHKTLAP